MDDSIIQKIKKLLALSKSANEHEAALALQRAQELMERHGVTTQDVDLADVQESHVASGNRRNMPQWMVSLANLIGDAFGVSWFQNETLVAPYTVKAEVVFVGIDAYAQISGYAFTVLRRQLERARRDFYNANKRYKKANRIRRADLFAIYWVRSVHSKVATFAASVKTEEKIEAYLAVKHPGLVPFKPKQHDFKQSDGDAALAGIVAGQHVTLNHGMRASDRPKAIQ